MCHMQDVHETILDKLSDYFERELSCEDLSKVETHLEECEQCRQEYASFETVLRGLASMPAEFAPASLPRKVRTRIRRGSRGRFFADLFIFQFRIPYEAFASVMLAVLGAMYILISPEEITGLQAEPAQIEREVQDDDGVITDLDPKAEKVPVKSETLGKEQQAHDIIRPDKYYEEQITLVLESPDPDALKLLMQEEYHQPDRQMFVTQDQQGRLILTMSQSERSRFLNTYLNMATSVEKQKVPVDPNDPVLPLVLDVIPISPSKN